ncbi:hypothetical protein GCM10017044_14050 [Kordiimonas sediminis]|uniref:UbiD family decarboxylase n=1 Tax=Kordiimonas sediminis TaxID=1735581 RepID=A0A919AQX0_9PROT|nr:UbiD family decarboxylase [Kordiimonas sediminis]GHF20386.1 hypothetical protein GCM10017044_14050 [Kordiimonas sediminis]
MAKKEIIYSTADLRSFLDDAQRNGLFLRVDKTVNIDTEVATLCAQAYWPTLFRSVEDYWNCLLVDGLTRNRNTQAMALGLDCAASDVVPGFAEKMSQGPGETVTIDNAPVKEIIWRDDDASLNRLPVPIPTEGKNFPKMNIIAEDFMSPVISGAIAIVKHPVTGVQATFQTMAKVVGDYRAQFTINSEKVQDILKAWSDMDQPCPIALVIGCHPAIELCAQFEDPAHDTCGMDYVSHFLGAPLPLTTCETADLQVPATAEIVIEGIIDQRREPYLHQSSPCGTFAPIVSMEPFFDVTALTSRENPIYRHMQPNPATDYHAAMELRLAPAVYMLLTDVGLTVHDVAMPTKTGGSCLIVQMTTHSADDIKTAYNTISGIKQPPRLVIFVDEDIDIYDLHDIVFALSTRCDPAEDLRHKQDMTGIPDAINTLINAGGGIEILPNNCWAIDATKPPLDNPDRRREFDRIQARGEGLFFLEDYVK